MKKILLSLSIFSFSFLAFAENVYVVGLASDGISSEIALWANGEKYPLPFLDGELLGFDIDGEYGYYATYKKNYGDIEISIYRSDETLLHNFKVKQIKSPYLTNLVVVNGNAYIVINYIGHEYQSEKMYAYKIYKNGVLQSEYDSGTDGNTCEMLEKSNGYVFIAKTKKYYSYNYDNRKSYWGYKGPNRDTLVALPSYYSKLYRLRVFNNDVYLMGSIDNTAYICQNNGKPQKISGYKKCTDFAIVNYSRYWIVDNILINSQGSTILTNVYGMRVYGNNLYVWGMYNHSYCYWIIYPNGHTERVDLPSCVGINNLNITD